jgi:hypothetical protein
MTHLLLRTAHCKRHDEVFSNRLRGDGASAATVANLGANLLVTVTSAVPSESGPQPPARFVRKCPLVCSYSGAGGRPLLGLHSG